MRGFALVELDEGRRQGDPSIRPDKIREINGLPGRTGWPQGANIINPVRPIRRLYGEDHTPKYDLYVEVEARNDDELKQIFGMLERLCHVDGYGG